MSLTSFSADEIAWASRTATRLRFVQADFSDLTPAERRQYLEEEVQRALSSLVPEKRPRHLEALGEYFPTGFTDRAETPVTASIDENSPEALVEALVRIAPQLPKRTLAEFGLRLQEAGYMELKSTTLMDAPPPEFHQQSPMETGQMVDLQRLYRLTLALADFYFRLEVFAWSVWKQIAPQARIRRDPSSTADLKKLAARYLAGDTEVSAEQCKAVIERMRQLISGVLGSLGGAGRGFAARFFADFAPDEILKMAKLDDKLGGFMVDDEKKCWRKYKQLIKDQTEQVIEEKLHQAIARSAEDLTRGLTRTGS